MSNTQGGNVEESTIRRMTRLCLQHQAVNLSQGFPNEPPPLVTRMAAAYAIVAGVPYNNEVEETSQNEDEQLQQISNSLTRFLNLSTSTSTLDVLNQYSPPMGRGDLRQAIAQHYQRLYDYSIDPETSITVTLGATEAVGSALRTIAKPGDRIVMFEPFHELYPSQCEIFHFIPNFVTLYEKQNGEGHGPHWAFQTAELEKALKGARALILNTPHNPTGKVFSLPELTAIVELCIRHNVFLITDDIYEYMTYQNAKHTLLPQAFAQSHPEILSKIFVCNSISKSASATGWRIGWCLHPPTYASAFRGIHDQLVVMAPHPLQYASISYLHLPVEFFRSTLKERYQARIVLLGEALREVGFQVPRIEGGVGVEGAYYLFVRYTEVEKLKHVSSAMEAAMFMIEEVGVGCVPGDNFYGTRIAIKEEEEVKAAENGNTRRLGTREVKRGHDYLRFAACRSLDDVVEACSRIRKKLG